MSKTADVTTRVRVSEKVSTNVLLKCRRKCCLCYFLENDRTEKDGQLAHIDRDPSNSNKQNLVFLCLRHHDEYDSIPRQTKRMTPGELKHYRSALQQELGTAPSQWELVIEGQVSEYPPERLKSLVESLQEFTDGLSISIKEVKQGSVVIHLESDFEAFKQVREAFRSGQLSARLGAKVAAVRIKDQLNVESMLSLANEFVVNGDYENIVKCVNPVIESMPSNSKAWFLKAGALLEEHYQTVNDPNDLSLVQLAYACSCRACELEPENVSCIAQQAAIIFELGRHEEALERIEVAIQTDSEAGLAYYNKGVMMEHLGKEDQAIKNFETAKQLGYPRAATALANAKIRAKRRLR